MPIRSAAARAVRSAMLLKSSRKPTRIISRTQNDGADPGFRATFSGRGEPAADFRGDVGMLKKDRALKVLATVQTGAQNEVAIEQRAGFAK